MGPLPQHDNFNPENYYDYEPLIMQCLHETAHLFWQVGDKNLDFGFGQWAWEAAALVAESMYCADGWGDYGANNTMAFDLTDACGNDAVNGVHSDGSKYNRTIVDANATSAFIYLASVLSDEGTCNYFQKVNDLRLAYYERTGVMSVGFDEYAAMLDEAAGGRTIDGRLVGSGTAKTGDRGEGTGEVVNLSGISGVCALKTVATTTVGGKTLTAATYSIYSDAGVDHTVGERMYIILTDDSGNIVTDVRAADVKVAGAKSVDTSGLPGGVLVLTVATGGTADISIGGSTFTFSQPLGVRVIPVTPGR